MDYPTIQNRMLERLQTLSDEEQQKGGVLMDHIARELGISAGDANGCISALLEQGKVVNATPDQSRRGRPHTPDILLTRWRLADQAPEPEPDTTTSGTTAATASHDLGAAPE